MYNFFNGGVLGLMRFQAESEEKATFLAAAALIGFCALCIIVPYLLGSINSAIVVSRLVYHDDVRQHGSKNAGATNMLRTFGWRAALLTLAGDALKTALAILFAWCMMGAQWIGAGFSMSEGAYLAMLFCVLGHNYPVYFRMKGGKGVLCTSVAIGFLSPWVLLILAVIFFATVAVTRYVSLGSVVCAASYPLFLVSLIRALFKGLSPSIVILLLAFGVMGLLIYGHRTNLVRLYRHEESKLSFRAGKPGKPLDDNDSDTKEE